MLQLPLHCSCMRRRDSEKLNKVQYLKIVLAKRPVKTGLFLCSNFDEKKEVCSKMELNGRQSIHNILYTQTQDKGLYS